MVLQGLDKGLNAAGIGAFVIDFLDWVIGDQVDVALEAAQVLGELVGMFGAIVEFCQQNIFK